MPDSLQPIALFSIAGDSAQAVHAFYSHVNSECVAFLLANGHDPTAFNQVGAVGRTYLGDVVVEGNEIVQRYLFVLNDDPLKEHKLDNFQQYASRYVMPLLPLPWR